VQCIYSWPSEKSYIYQTRSCTMEFVVVVDDEVDKNIISLVSCEFVHTASIYTSEQVIIKFLLHICSMFLIVLLWYHIYLCAVHFLTFCNGIND
jgi:hypothetical protein